MLEEEVVSLSPCSFSLVSGIIAARFERQGRVINKGVDFLFDIVGKSGRVGPGFVSKLQSFLNRYDRHVLDSCKNIFIFINKIKLID